MSKPVKVDRSIHSGRMLLIPEGTHIFEPDGINQVTLMFPNENDAIVFFEYLKSLLQP